MAGRESDTFKMANDNLDTIADWPDDPMGLFRQWYERAEQTDSVAEPEVMALATATSDGRPSVRMLLLRGYDDSGFCFYTNYKSRKGDELARNPRASAVFYWRALYLQVRIEGSVEKLTAAESDAYFDSRDRVKRTSAAVSSQSRPISDWRELRDAADRLLESDAPVSRPEHWGGYRVRPDQIEFWAGSRDRMHRRCLYTFANDAWSRELLAP